MNVDPSLINTQSTLGQVTLLILVGSTLLINLKPVISSSKKQLKQRNLASLTEELRASRREVLYSRHLVRDLSDWQLTARETIRYQRNKMIDAGVEPDPRIESLLKLLEEIEQRPTRYDEEEEEDD